MQAAESIWNFIEEINASGGVDNAAVQPTTPPGVSACSTGAGAASAPAKEHSHKHEHNNGADGGCCGGGCH